MIKKLNFGLIDLSAIYARREKLRETLDRMRSIINRFTDVPDSGVDVPIVEQHLKTV